MHDVIKLVPGALDHPLLQPAVSNHPDQQPAAIYSTQPINTMMSRASNDQGALPAKGKEYPGLGYKRLRDKPPKAQEQQQQQQQPAVAQ
ncbi:hypothetical protein QJQ45_001234 [Haematococcus lacustris]|nr:hypothetical protein QJQ45_001234 [Haematococcus lacustris]